MTAARLGLRLDDAIPASFPCLFLAAEACAMGMHDAWNIALSFVYSF